MAKGSDEDLNSGKEERWGWGEKNRTRMWRLEDKGPTGEGEKATRGCGEQEAGCWRWVGLPVRRAFTHPALGVAARGCVCGRCEWR